MKTSLIVAMAENRAIGKDNQMPWHLPADLKHFRKLTTGHHIIMGRKTYESIGKPLPNRVSVIITRNENYEASGCLVVSSLEEAIQKAKDAGETEAFIIGGAQIYQQSVALADRVYLTQIKASFEADAFFPELGKGWEVTAQKSHSADDKNPYDYDFLTLEKA